MNEHVESLNHIKTTAIELAIKFGLKVFVAIAMQGVPGNVVAGLTIIFTRPFRVSEYISIAGVEGKVEDITLFSTTLTHPDLSRVVVPNRKIVSEILHKYGKIRQLNITIPFPQHEVRMLGNAA